jgi:hypothetical protein
MDLDRKLLIPVLSGRMFVPRLRRQVLVGSIVTIMGKIDIVVRVGRVAGQLSV